MAAPAAMWHPAGGHQLEGWGGGRRCLGRGGPVLEGGVVKAGWRVLHRDPANRGSQWPYLPPRFPLPHHLYIEEVDIRRWARDAERKSQDCLRMGGHRVLKMPPLRDLPMPWQLSPPQEANFWKGRDVVTGEDLELGRPPPRVQLEDVGWQIPWMPEVEPAEEGLPLAPLGPGPMEVDGTRQAPGDGAVVGEAVDSEETNSSLDLFWGWCPVANDANNCTLFVQPNPPYMVQQWKLPLQECTWITFTLPHSLLSF